VITHYVTRDIYSAGKVTETINSRRLRAYSARVESRPPSRAYPKKGPLYIVIVDRLRRALA
jgi:hypothetical protein